MDYNAPNPLEVTFTAGVDGQGSTACANINIIDDEALEGLHDFTVTLIDFDIVGGTPGTARIFMGTPNSATVFIEDNEGTWDHVVFSFQIPLMLCTYQCYSPMHCG